MFDSPVDWSLLGAMVLAHSLRDNGTKAKLVVLATVDSLRTSTVEELKVLVLLFEGASEYAVDFIHRQYMTMSLR